MDIDHDLVKELLNVLLFYIHVFLGNRYFLREQLRDWDRMSGAVAQSVKRMTPGD